MLVMLAGALTAVPMLAGGAAAHAQRGAGHVYADPAGDAGAADFANVVIDGDVASGALRLSVTAHGMFAIDRGREPDISVWLDTDQDRSTGSASGCEYGLKFWRTPSEEVWHILRWDDDTARWEAIPASTTTSFSRSGAVLTWRFTTADIGGASGFQFWLASAIYQGRRIIGEDIAPARARWPYVLADAPATFHDDEHDAAAPDLVKAVAARGSAAGAMTFSVTARGLSAISRALRPDVDVYMDTDRNESTGSSGADHRLSYSVRPAGTVWHVYRWNPRGKAWRSIPRSLTARFARHGDVLTWRFSRADIGNATSFEFSVASAIYVSGKVIIEDFSPEYGRWSYRP
jgi:hypothetical protein